MTTLKDKERTRIINDTFEEQNIFISQDVKEAVLEFRKEILRELNAMIINYDDEVSDDLIDFKRFLEDNIDEIFGDFGEKETKDKGDEK